MAEQMSPLGRWLDQLFIDIFFQPDDELSTKAHDEGFSKNFRNTVNGHPFDAATFGSLIKKARSEYRYVLGTHTELFVVSKDGRQGHVSTKSSWTKIDKATGKETPEENVLIATVGVEDGKMVLVEMVELAS